MIESKEQKKKKFRIFFFEVMRTRELGGEFPPSLCKMHSKESSELGLRFALFQTQNKKTKNKRFLSLQ